MFGPSLDDKGLWHRIKNRVEEIYEMMSNLAREQDVDDIKRRLDRLEEKLDQMLDHEMFWSDARREAVEKDRETQATLGLPRRR